jgi:hypothetical protein
MPGLITPVALDDDPNRPLRIYVANLTVGILSIDETGQIKGTHTAPNVWCPPLVDPAGAIYFCSEIWPGAGESLPSRTSLYKLLPTVDINGTLPLAWTLTLPNNTEHVGPLAFDEQHYRLLLQPTVNVNGIQFEGALVSVEAKDGIIIWWVPLPSQAWSFAAHILIDNLVRSHL